MKNVRILSVLMMLALLAAACAPQATPVPTQVAATEPPPTNTPEPTPTPEPQPSIAEIAVNDGRFTTLVSALEAAGLVDTLSGDGSFTVFAPTDDAFKALPEGTIESLLMDESALNSVLLYHVVDGVVYAADVTGLDGQSVATLSGEEITVNIADGSVMINDSNVIITDIEAANGVIHVIDSVLIPESIAMAMAETESSADDEMSGEKNIVDIAVEDGRFTTLVAALEAADLVEALQGEGPFTVFAPTDEAFNALPEGTIPALLEDKEALTNVLLFHVIEGKVMAEDAIALAGKKAATLQGQFVDITLDGESVMIDGATVTIADIEASNGVIHVIDSVLLPEDRTIAEIAAEDDRFSTLVTALQQADLVDALNAEGPFTVFAPTNEAFEALPAGTLDGLLADTNALSSVLLYHVVQGKVMASDVVELDGKEASTLSGANLMVDVADNGVQINQSNVIITDVEASNGVIHVIDTVLVP